MSLRATVMVVVVAMAACGKSPAPSAPVGDAAPSDVAYDAGPVTIVTVPEWYPPAPTPTETPSGGDACSAETYRAGLRDGRKAFAEKEYAAARTFFERAMVARPLDPVVRGELGYAQLFTGDLRDADANLRVGASLARGNGKLAAQIWFNRGLVAEKEGRAEIARAAFAVSDRLAPSDAARAKLKNRSRCSIAVERASSSAAKLSIVTGWKQVHAALVPQIMGGDDGIKERAAPPPATEAEARDRACRDYWLSERADGNPCSGKPPWQIRMGHIDFRSIFMVVDELPGGRFALIHVMAGGGGPAANMHEFRFRHVGARLLETTTNAESHFVTRDSSCLTANSAELRDAGTIGYGDVSSLTTTSFTVYDTTDGRPVAEGVAWGEGADQAIDLGSDALLLKNVPGCPASVPLP